MECFTPRRRDFPCYCYKMAVAGTADTCSPVPKAVQVIKIYTDENGESKFGSFKITMSGSGKLLNPAAVHVVARSYVYIAVCLGARGECKMYVCACISQEKRMCIPSIIMGLLL